MRTKDTVNHIHAALQQDILSLKLKPGQLIKEGDFCDRFGASRTPVHAALERLNQEGLIEFMPYRGVRPTLLKFSDIYQTILLRTILETKVLEEFSHSADPFILEKVTHAVRNQQILLESEQFEPSRFYIFDSELHALWFTYQKVPLFWQVIQDSEVHYTRFRMLDIVRIHNFKEIVKEHEVLLSLLKSQDAQQIGEVVSYHLFGGIRRMQHLLRHELAPYFIDSEDIGSYLTRILALRKPDCLLIEE